MKYGYIDDVKGIDFTLPQSPKFQSKYLSGEKCVKLNFYIGSSVWADKDYKGSFYPPKTPQKDFLKAYSAQFNSVEVNATRYGTPKQTTLNTWRNAVPDHFKFSFKMPQIISVRKNLLDKDVLNRLEEFLLAMNTMGEKAGTTFILLQNSFNAERLKELDTFLSYLPKEQSFATEIRNPTFNQSEALGDILHKHNIANVCTDTAGERDVVQTMITNNTAYVRFVGNNLVKTDYERIDAWVNKFKQLTNQGVQNFYCLHHQPNTNRAKSGFAASYMIEQIKAAFPEVDLKKPHNFSFETLF